MNDPRDAVTILIGKKYDDILNFNTMIIIARYLYQLNYKTYIIV